MKLKDLEIWLTPSQAAERIGISRQALYKTYLDAGRLRAVHTQAGWLIDPESVEDLRRKKGDKH